MKSLKPVLVRGVAGLMAAAASCLGGCMGTGPEPLRSAPMAEAGQALPHATRYSLRIDLADQETEGFHFEAPADVAARVAAWQVYYAPATADKPGPDGLPLPAPAPVPLSAFGAEHFLTVRLFDCVTVNNPLGASLSDGTRKDHVPDALIPMAATGDGFTSALAADDGRANRHLWVELTWQVDAAVAEEAPERVLHGRHNFRVMGLDAANQPLMDLGFSAVFHDFTLPVQGRFRTMVNWNTSIEGYYGKPVLTESLRHGYYDFFLHYRLSPTAFAKQEMEPSLADLPYCASRGLNSINLYSIQRQKGMLPQAELDKIRQIGAQVKDTLEEWGLSDSAFVLVGTSSAVSDVDSICTNADTVHDSMPWARVWMFAAPNDVLSHRINAWTTLTAAETKAFSAISYDREMREKHAGDQDLNLWFVGQEPTTPYANLLLSNRAADAHVLALQTWANNISGLVFPHATAWPWNGAAKADFPAREWVARRDGLGVLCYPLPSGLPCPSVRLVNLRDGLENAEALREAEILAYNLDIYNQRLAKVTLPALEDALRKFDNVGHTEDLEKKLQAKAALTRAQLAAIPAQLKALTSIVKEYQETYAQLDRAGTADEVELYMTLRRRLYRVIDSAEPLARAIDANLADPLSPQEGEGEAAPAGDLPMPADNGAQG